MSGFSSLFPKSQRVSIDIMATKKKSRRETDDPSRAPESGDPKESGRSHGEIIDESGAPAGRREDGKGGDTDYESGRHGTK